MYWKLNWITVTEFNVAPNELGNKIMYWELNWITVTEFTVTTNELSSNSMYWEVKWITVTEFTVKPNEEQYVNILKTELNNNHRIQCSTKWILE